MMTAFRTQVFYASPSPLGLVCGRWVVDHYRTVCRHLVGTAELVPHAQSHVAAAPDAEDDKPVP